MGRCGLDDDSLLGLDVSCREGDWLGLASFPNLGARTGNRHVDADMADPDNFDNGKHRQETIEDGDEAGLAFAGDEAECQIAVTRGERKSIVSP